MSRTGARRLRFVVIFFSVFFHYQAISQTQLTASHLTPPSLLENKNSKKIKRTHRSSRHESWAFTSYIVDTQGIPRDMIIVDTSEKKNYMLQPERYINNLRYSPAQQAGQNVPYSISFLIKHDMSFIAGNNDGVSPGFAKRYQKLGKLINDNKFDKAEKLFTKLYRDNVKNLTEQAMAAWLSSKYYFHREDWPAYRDEIKVAYHLRYNMPKVEATKNMINLYKWYHFKKQYADAMQVIFSLQEDAYRELITQKQFDTMVKQTQTAIEDSGEIEIENSLSNSGTWLHHISHSEVNVLFDDDHINFLEVRCKNLQLKPKLKIPLQITIPSKAIGCALLIQGKPNTKVLLNEKGDTLNLL